MINKICLEKKALLYLLNLSSLCFNDNDVDCTFETLDKVFNEMNDVAFQNLYKLAIEQSVWRSGTGNLLLRQ